jgi:hypothetical protein
MIIGDLKEAKTLSQSSRNRNLLFLIIYRVSPVGFDKMLPRDNKMFNVSEGFNLKPAAEPSIIEKLAALDIDIRKLKVKDNSQNSSYYSDSTS